MAAAAPAAVSVSALIWPIVMAASLSTIAPDSSRTDWHTLGLALSATGQHRDAIAAFETCILTRSRDQHEDALLIARAYEQLGNGKQAARWREIAKLRRLREAELHGESRHSTARAVE